MIRIMIVAIIVFGLIIVGNTFAQKAVENTVNKDSEYPKFDNVKEAIEAAKQGLPKELSALKSVPTDMLKGYGFSDWNEVEQSQLGEPIRVYGIDYDKLRTFDGKTSILEMIKPYMYRFPIIVKNQMRELMDVAFMNGRWQWVGGGANALAKEWDYITKKYPTSQGYENSLLMAHVSDCTFAITRKADRVIVIPLFNYKGDEFEYHKEFEPSFILFKLKERFPKQTSTKSFHELPLGGNRR